MKVLFVNVIDQKSAVQSRYYPLSFAYLVSYAEKHGCHFDYCYVESLDQKVLLKHLPDVVALTCITENYDRALLYAELAKKFNPEIVVVVGGIHISSVPNSLSSCMDAGVLGEGEQTFLELANNNFVPDDSINGLVYWKNSVLCFTGERGLIEPLDSIPHPKRNIFGSTVKAPYLFTSRGCSYRCSFCSSSRFWKKTRFHSAEYIFEEIKELIASGCSHINVYDDCFPLDIDRVRRVAELVKDLNVTFSLSIRANLVSDEMAMLLKKMHVVEVGMGLESNSDRILKLLNKGNTSVDNQRAIDVLRLHGFRVHCSFIHVPSETLEDKAATYNFIKRNGLAGHHDFYALMRFPNTPLYDGSTDWAACKVKNFSEVGFVGRLFRKMFRFLRFFG